MSAQDGPASRSPARRDMLHGERVYRIHWVLGTDRLRAVCHCTAEREFDDPVELWDWLLGHPAGHDAVAAPAYPPHAFAEV